MPTGTDLPMLQIAPETRQARPSTLTAALMPKRKCAAMKLTKNTPPAIFSKCSRVMEIRLTLEISGLP